MSDDQIPAEAEPKPAPRITPWNGRIRCGCCGAERFELGDPVPLDPAARYRCEKCGTDGRHTAYQVEG